MSSLASPCFVTEFCNEVRFFLKANGLKQSDLVRSCSTLNKVKLSRILSGKRKPSALEIEEILIVIKKSHKVHSYQKQIHPQLNDFISSKNETNANARMMTKIEENFFNDKHAHWILVKAQTKFGIKKSEIKKKFGDYGLTILRRMEMADIVSSKNGVVRYNRLKPTAGVESILSQMKMNIDFFDESKVGLEQVAAVNLLLETTKEGRREVHKVLARASKEIKAIVNKNQPSTPLDSEVLFANLLMGDYDSKN